jgi:HlyD family secretion protein
MPPPFMDERARAEARAQADAALAAVGVAEAELEQARSSLVLARSDYERARRLASSQAISEASLEKARIDVELKQALVASAGAAVALRRSEMASANARLMQPGDRTLVEGEERCCLRLQAPIDGVVLSLAVKSEQVIQAGAQLAEIGDPANLEIVVDLLSADAARLRLGTTATVAGWGGDPIAATLRRIDPAGFTKVSALGIEEQRVNAVLDLARPEPALGHGFQVRVALEIWREDNVLQIPVSALFREGSDWAAFAIEGARASKRIVEIGQLNNETAQVLSGLAEGETVIVFASDRIADGTLVERRE